MVGRKPIIGIVGAVGSGKSTVAAEFARGGCGVIDADQLNHEILARTAIINQLKAWLGEKIMASDGGIDRKALSDMVLEDSVQLKKLTDLVHPLIRIRQRELIEQYQGDPGIKAIVLDVPLLVEVGWQDICDVVVYVKVAERLRRERLISDRGWTAERIKKVEKLHLALDIKEKLSEYTINNNSGIPVTASQVDRVLNLILEKWDSG